MAHGAPDAKKGARPTTKARNGALRAIFVPHGTGNGPVESGGFRP